MVSFLHDPLSFFPISYFPFRSFSFIPVSFRLSASTFLLFVSFIAALSFLLFFSFPFNSYYLLRSLFTFSFLPSFAPPPFSCRPLFHRSPRTPLHPHLLPVSSRSSFSPFCSSFPSLFPLHFPIFLCLNLPILYIRIFLDPLSSFPSPPQKEWCDYGHAALFAAARHFSVLAVFCHTHMQVAPANRLCHTMYFRHSLVNSSIKKSIHVKGG